MKAGVVGFPVSHSLSPAVWRAAYDSLGLGDWTYELLERDEAGFRRLLAEGADGGWAGLSVTMPYKHLASMLVDRTAGRTGGAVNTVVFTEDGTVGHNTDVDGIVAALNEVRAEGPGRVVVLGAGGTAAAAVLAATSLHATSIELVARNAGPAQETRERTGRVAGFTPWTQALEAVETADVVVNTTPRAAADELAVAWEGGPLVEVLYDPWPTPLASAAESGGHPVVGGLFVLVHQALRQIELVTGQRPDPAPLLAAVEAARASR